MCCCSGGCRDAFGTLHPGQRPINRSTLARNDRPARSLPVLACTLRRAQSAPLHLTARNHCAPLVKAQAPIRPLPSSLSPLGRCWQVKSLQCKHARTPAAWRGSQGALSPLLLLFLLLSQILPLQMAAVRRWPSAVQTAAPAAHGRTPLRSKNARCLKSPQPAAPED